MYRKKPHISCNSFKNSQQRTSKFCTAYFSGNYIFAAITWLCNWTYNGSSFLTKFLLFSSTADRDRRSHYKGILRVFGSLKLQRKKHYTGHLVEMLRFMDVVLGRFLGTCWNPNTDLNFPFYWSLAEPKIYNVSKIGMPYNKKTFSNFVETNFETKFRIL